jgi:thymidine kinase
MMALADEVITLKSYCMVCGRDANKTQRLSRKSNRIVIGGAGQYEPRCNEHWEPK